jgi:hypothetical protein
MHAEYYCPCAAYAPIRPKHDASFSGPDKEAFTASNPTAQVHRYGPSLQHLVSLAIRQMNPFPSDADTGSAVRLGVHV